MQSMRVRVFLVLTSVLIATPLTFGGDAMKPGEWIDASKAKATNKLKKDGVLSYINKGAWAEFGPFDLSDGLVDRIEIQLAAPAPGGRIAVCLDKPGGEKVAEVYVQDTGGYGTYAAMQADSEQLGGTHKLVLQFLDKKNACNVKAFRFLKPDQKGSPKALVSKAPPSPEEIMRGNRAAIQEHRTTLLTVRAPAGAKVEVKQVRHHFEFGTAISRKAFVADSKMSPADQKKYKEILKANFNSVVHENAMKWYSNERQQGNYTFDAADTMLDWSEKNGLFTRGHCVYWGRDKVVQKWIKELDDDALRKKLRERAKIYMTRYKGRVPEHDINNEMLHCSYFKNRLGGEIRQQMFAWCHQYDPEATLYVNDYGILTGGGTGSYVRQIEGFLKRGMKVGGIGVQGHFGGHVNGPDVKNKLDQLAKFGLPIKVTEFDANTSDEQAKARAVATLYSTAFAHPAIEGIYMWGFWKNCHWRPRAGLWNADWSETPAAKVYRDLVFNQWWTDESVRAGKDGTVGIRVFFGKHEITVNGEGRIFEISPEQKDAVIDCRGKATRDWMLISEKRELE